MYRQAETEGTSGNLKKFLSYIYQLKNLGNNLHYLTERK